MYPSNVGVDCVTTSLPLSSLYGLCQKLSILVVAEDNFADSNVQQRLAAEQRLWNEVKKIRHLNDGAVYDYLIGYYSKILFQLGTPTRGRQNKQALNDGKHIGNDLFFYHVLIRLGDLSRYSGDEQQAKFYYSNARNLFHNYGHAYNQLALLTPAHELYRCCYYYARAAKSVQEPLAKVSDGNLRIAVNKYNCFVLSHVLSEDPAPLSESDCQFLPKKSFDWLYLMIVAIYADNLQPIVRPFLNFLIDNFFVCLNPDSSTHTKSTIQNGESKSKIGQAVKFPCDESSFILLATFDVMLDWIDSSVHRKNICQIGCDELLKIKLTLGRVISISPNTNASNKKMNLKSLQISNNSMMSADNSTCNLSSVGTSRNNSNNSLHQFDPSIISYNMNGQCHAQVQGRASALDSLRSNGNGNANNTPCLSSCGSVGTCDSPISIQPSSNGHQKCDDFIRTKNDKLLAPLLHDYLLRGYEPLAKAHSYVAFDDDAGSNIQFLDDLVGVGYKNWDVISSRTFFLLMERISLKLDKLSPLVRKKTRNIALESIRLGSYSGPI